MMVMSVSAVQQSNSKFFVPTPLPSDGSYPSPTPSSASEESENSALSVSSTSHAIYHQSQSSTLNRKAENVVGMQRHFIDDNNECSSTATPQLARRLPPLQQQMSANITDCCKISVAGGGCSARLPFGKRDLMYYRIDVCRKPGEPPSSFVQRRFNDFYNLAQHLRRDYPGRNIPMPDKERLQTAFSTIQTTLKPATVNTTTTVDSELKRRRIKRLDEFVQFVIGDAELMAHPLVAEFFGPATVAVKLSGDSLNSDEMSGASLSVVPASNEVQQQQQQQLSLGPSEQQHMRPDDFQFLKMIGRGNFGKVYQARMKKNNKIYAVKVLDKSRVNHTERDRSHVFTERDILITSLDHPFLVGLQFSFRSKSKLYFVMEFVNGGELFFHLQKSGFFSEDLSCFYSAEIASALGYLHSRDIIYRDLKPENLLLDAEGHIKLTDFGLCKKLLKESENQHATQRTRTYCGTPEYLAPELIRRESYGFEVDWWCLGAVTYEMVFSLPPWYSKDHQRMHVDILNAPLELDRCDRRVSASCKKFLRELLVRDPQERLGHRADFAAIERHPFFSRINWADLLARRIQPPFKPRVLSQYDLTNIDPGFHREPVSESVGVWGALNNKDSGYCGGGGDAVRLAPQRCNVSVREADNDNFEGFSYVRPLWPNDVE